MTKLLFLGCNHDQLPYLLELQKYQFEIIGTDLNSNAPGKKLCNKFYQVGYDNYDGLINVGMKEKFNSDDSIFTASAQFAHKGAAHFANKFDIRYPAVRNIDICLDKTLFYNKFQKLGIPIPETSFITNKENFVSTINELDENSNYYLKSDFSKNPNYVYRFNPKNVIVDDIFWGRDRYLQNHYILQNEFIGETLRINIYGDRFNVFQFEPMKKISEKKKELVTAGVIKSLSEYIKNLGLDKWLVKFDVIINNGNYVVLDVGLDPPSRMVKEAKLQGINFVKFYINQYLNQKVDYPQSLD